MTQVPGFIKQIQYSVVFCPVGKNIYHDRNTRQTADWRYHSGISFPPIYPLTDIVSDRFHFIFSVQYRKFFFTMKKRTSDTGQIFYGEYSPLKVYTPAVTVIQ